MTDLDPDDLAGYAVYKLLSAVGGKDLKQAKVEELRERRQEFLEANEIMGGPPFHHKRHIETLLDMGLEEAEYMRDFEPDLCIMSRSQYKELANISAAVPINPDKLPDSISIPDAEVQGLAEMQPPYYYLSGDRGIRVTYSEATDKMILVDGSELSETVEL